MPKRGRKFITEFLIPNLNTEKFGTRLAWLDKENFIFQIQWSHKSASNWTKNDCEVFIEWDKKQGHYNPVDKEYYSKCKQRFRAVLYKLIKANHLKKLESSDKNMLTFYLGNAADRCKDAILEGTKTNDASFKNADELTNNLENKNVSQVHLFDTSVKKNCEHALKDHNYLYNKEEVATGTKKTLYPLRSTRKNYDFSGGKDIFDGSEIPATESTNYEICIENEQRLPQDSLESTISCDTILENPFEEVDDENILLTVNCFMMNESELENMDFSPELT